MTIKKLIPYFQKPFEFYIKWARFEMKGKELDSETIEILRKFYDDLWKK